MVQSNRFNSIGPSAGPVPLTFASAGPIQLTLASAGPVHLAFRASRVPPGQQSPKYIFFLGGGGYPPWPTAAPDSPWPPESPDPPWPPEPNPEFPLSLGPFTRLCSCVSCVLWLKSHYLPYLLSPASFPLHDRDTNDITITWHSWLVLSCICSQWALCLTFKHMTSACCSS